MKEETAREFYAALERACELLNSHTKHKASPDDVLRMGAKFAPGIPQRTVKAAARGGAMGFLRSLPEPSETEKAHLLTLLGDLPFTMRRVFTQVGKELPYRRGKKTPPKLDTQQKRKEACDDVARLLSCGVEKTDALKHVGKKYGASDRTIRRIWEKYCKATGEPQ